MSGSLTYAFAVHTFAKEDRCQASEKWDIFIRSLYLHQVSILSFHIKIVRYNLLKYFLLTLKTMDAKVVCSK